MKLSDNYIQQPSRQIKHAVLKGINSQNHAFDANMMAHIEKERISKEQFEKKNKMESFLNNTRMNASKICKEKQQKHSEIIQNKKIILDKQKQLKAKYTIIDKKIEEANKIEPKPVKVEWKKAEDASKRIKISEQKPFLMENDSDDEGSGVDSEYGYEKCQTPAQLLKSREDVRSKMLSKANLK